MKTLIKGLRFYNFNKPKKGERVILIAEPTNLYDSNAIAIYNLECQKMGYLPNDFYGNQEPRFKLCFESNLPIKATVMLTPNKSIIIDIEFPIAKVERVMDRVALREKKKSAERRKWKPLNNSTRISI